MKNLLKALFLFFLPIFKQAAAQAVADKVTEYAYPPRQPRPYKYDRTATMNLGRAFREAEATRVPPRRPERNLFADPKYHDVLMLALDITGPNKAIVHAFLEGLMPETGGHDDGINVDSWWIADDDYPHCDTDSAVFVSKGNQDAARRLLREHGLVD